MSQPTVWPPPVWSHARNLRKSVRPWSTWAARTQAASTARTCGTRTSHSPARCVILDTPRGAFYTSTVQPPKPLAGAQVPPPRLSAFGTFRIISTFLTIIFTVTFVTYAGSATITANCHMLPWASLERCKRNFMPNPYSSEAQQPTTTTDTCHAVTTWRAHGDLAANASRPKKVASLA